MIVVGKKAFKKDLISKSNTDKLNISSLYVIGIGCSGEYETVHTRYFDRSKDKEIKCPKCNGNAVRTSKIEKRTFYELIEDDFPIEETEVFRASSKVVTIEFNQRYLACKQNHVFPEPVDFIDKGCIYAHRLSDAIAKRILYYSYRKVCNHFNVPSSPASIKPLVNRYISNLCNQMPPIKTPNQLTLLEIPFSKNSYILALSIFETNTDNHIKQEIYAIDIFDSPSGSKIREFLKELNSIKISTVYIDPIDDLRNTVCAILPNTQIIVSKECLLRYAKNALIEVKKKDGKFFPIRKNRNDTLTLPNKHLAYEDLEKLEKGFYNSRFARLKKAYDYYQELIDIFYQNWNYTQILDWANRIPANLNKFDLLKTVIKNFQSEIIIPSAKLPDDYSTEINGIFETFENIPSGIFEVLRARCFFSITYDKITESNDTNRLGIRIDRFIANLKKISEIIEDRRYK